jgi:lipoprotein-releasing system ATP-binding protein
MAFIELRNVSKSYYDTGHEVRVLRDLSWQVEQGASAAVVGASGVGKSTLLHILGALDRPDQGALTVAGKDIFSNSPAALAEFRNRRVGFVFQFHHLLPEFSALENVMMPALVGGWEKQTARRRAKELLAQVGLQTRLAHRLSQLSGGEQQRAAVARALIMTPSILLADEPTGNLDQDNAQTVHELIIRLNRELNLTTIVVTHNEQLAGLMDARYLLSQGVMEALP